MKLVLAVVTQDDLAALLIALAREGFLATVFHAPGNPLQTDVSLMIGTPAAKTPELLAVFRHVCRQRPRASMSLVPGLTGVPPQDDAGGALCVVLKVARFERLAGSG